jgi:hypothetical protein
MHRDHKHRVMQAHSSTSRKDCRIQEGAESSAELSVHIGNGLVGSPPCFIDDVVVVLPFLIVVLSSLDKH